MLNKKDRVPIWIPSEESRQQLRDTAYIHVEDESAIDQAWGRLIEELLLGLKPYIGTSKVNVICETDMWIAVSVSKSITDTVHEQADTDDPELRRALSLCHTRTIQEHMDYSHSGNLGRESFILPKPEKSDFNI